MFIVIAALFAGVQTFVPTISKAKESFGVFLNAPAGVSYTDKTKISFVGDVMLARNVENLMQTYGFWYPFAHLPNLDESSFLIGNFESAIPKIHKPTKDFHFSFSTDPTFLEGLVSYGFTHMSLANNHSYDYGSEGFATTYQELTKVGLGVVGDPHKQASSSIEVVVLDGVTIALIGLYAVDVMPSESEIQSLIERATQDSQIQVVYVHWGTEYKTTHSRSQEELAHRLIDAGADTIIGHHPHVVQDVGFYKGKPIFYSLGNFIFDQYFSEDVQEGLLVEMSATSQNLQFILIPVTSIGSRSAPRLMNDFEKDVFLKKLSKNSHTELAPMIESGSLRLEQ